MRTPWLSTNYKLIDKSLITDLPMAVKEREFHVLLNAEYGSWVVLNAEEYSRYLENKLNETELEILFNRFLAVNEDGSYLELDFPKPATSPSVIVVNITTRCNLKCKYCFVGCEPTKGDDMTIDVMKATAENMLQMPSEKITFELQGGEPFANFEGFKDFVLITEEANKKYNKSITFRTMTNATLVTDELADFCKQHGVTVGVSLDGPKELHDSVRIDENNEGTLTKALVGIKLLRDKGVLVDGAVCTLGQHNVKNYKEIVDFFEDINLSFKPRPINILGRELENRMTTKPGEWFNCFKNMHEYCQDKKVNNFSIHIFEENAYTPIRDYICMRYPCGAAREVISVNPDGTVYPCDGFKGEKDFIIGNILNESLESILKKEKVIKIQNRTAKDIEKCSTCMFRAMCCSCCYSAQGAYGTIYREDPHCADRRAIFIHLIRTWIEQNCIQ